MSYEKLARWQVRLICSRGHDHIMGYEQGHRLVNEPCCWCKRPIVYVEHGRCPGRIPQPRFGQLVRPGSQS